jgi:hypothetical protein
MGDAGIFAGIWYAFGTLGRWAAGKTMAGCGPRHDRPVVPLSGGISTTDLWVMSPTTLVFSTTYKTQAALEKPCK